MVCLVNDTKQSTLPTNEQNWLVNDDECVRYGKYSLTSIRVEKVIKNFILFLPLEKKAIMLGSKISLRTDTERDTKLVPLGEAKLIL